MTEKQNPPDGMAMAYLYAGEPFVYVGPTKVDSQRWRNARGADIFDADDWCTTPIHPLDPADPQPWAIAPEPNHRRTEWRSWIVRRSNYSHCNINDHDEWLEVVKNNKSVDVSAIYRRHTIHGVDLLERVYLSEDAAEEMEANEEYAEWATAPKVSEIDWNPDPWVRPPEWVQVPERSWAGTRIGGKTKFSVTRRGNPVVVDQSPADDVVARYNMTGHLIGYRGPDGEWVETKPEKLGRWRHRDGHVADLDARTWTWKDGRHGPLSPSQKKSSFVDSHLWARIPDDEPDGGPSTVHPDTPKCPACGLICGSGPRCRQCCHMLADAPTCPECSGRQTTGMGPCSLCTPKPKPEPPPAILRKCPQTGNLSLRLEVLSPEREVAMTQIGVACGRIPACGPSLGLILALSEMRLAIYMHYPRTRHIEAVRAAFVEYVRSQEDVPKGLQGSGGHR